MVVCVIYSPASGNATILKVSDTIPNVQIYSRELAKKIASSMRGKGIVIVKCGVPDYSVYQKPLYVLYTMVNNFFKAVAVGDDAKRLIEVSPSAKPIVMSAVSYVVNDLNELLALMSNF